MKVESRGRQGQKVPDTGETVPIVAPIPEGECDGKPEQWAAAGSLPESTPQELQAADSR